MLGLLFGIQGRISRRTYWTLKLSALAVIGAIVVAVMMATPHRPGDRHVLDHALQALPPAVHGAVLAAFVLFGWVVAAAYIKRLHDLNLSGRQMIGSHWRVMWEDGTVGPNPYGPDPLARPPKST